ncbi:MAG: hypothetical protein ACTHM0_01985 [Sphingomonas sp.]
MPRKQKLKVYRTPIGFHDAYVAAPSQKAALKAWGSDADLFARGVAEVVTDPELTPEPLARPGEVIKRSRGTAAEQIAALPAERKRRKTEASPEEKPPARQAKPHRTPRPDRAPVEEAERALEAARERHRGEERALAKEAAALDRRRRALEKEQRDEIARLEKAHDRMLHQYEAAVRRWRG